VTRIERRLSRVEGLEVLLVSLPFFRDLLGPTEIVSKLRLLLFGSLCLHKLLEKLSYVLFFLHFFLLSLNCVMSIARAFATIPRTDDSVLPMRFAMSL